MPTASDEMREKIKAAFGNGIDLMGPLKYLIDRGYTDDRGILKPPKDHEPTEEEELCIDFLFHEWDFGFDPNGVKR